MPPETAADRLRVAWIIDVFDEVSGVVTDSEEMYEKALERGVFWQPITCYGKDIYPFHRFHPLLKLPMGSFYKGTYLYLPAFMNIIRYLREKRINIIVSNTPGIMGMFAAAAARYFSIPWVDIYHTDLEFYADKLGPYLLTNPLVKPFFNRAGLFYLKQYQKQADLIFVRTREYYDLLRQKGHPAAKLRYYPAGVNINYWHPDHRNRDIWQQYQIDPEKKIVLYVGRITKVKDITLLLDAFARENFENAELVLIGGGPEKNAYEREYRSVKNIHFLGIKRGEELQQMYASSDLYVLPSASETLGKTVLEAMSSETPVLVSDKGGPKDYVSEGITGGIFKAYNYDSFAAKLKEMLSDSEKLAGMRKPARAAMQNHTNDSLFDSFTSHLTDLL